ncbi:hypothetical protein EON65_41065 [archaeon]|nr:MAG: hypothetical protein EON65_41065 [archaeon]
MIGRPRRLRHKFANAVLELCESTGRRYGGYVIRRERTHVEVMIVVKPCREDELPELYQVLAEFGVDADSFVFTESNFTEVHRLRRRFCVIRQGQEPDDFSNDVEDPLYEVMGSIHSHASSGVF